MKPFALLLALFCASSASAGPKDWAKHHKRFLLMEGTAIAGASIHAAGLHHCRKTNGVEPCDEHYGLAWAAYGFTTGLTVIAAPAIAEGCWKDNPSAKFCYIFGYAGSAYQGTWGVHEWLINKPKDKS